MRLQELLQAPELVFSRILASGEALSRHVNWVNVYELLDELSLVEAGDLILTDGYDLHRYQDDYRGLCQRIIQQKAAGLGLVVGKYLAEIPAGLLMAAWETRLPLFLLPPGREVADYGKLIIQLITLPHEVAQASPDKAALRPASSFRVCSLTSSVPDGALLFGAKLSEFLALHCRCFVIETENPCAGLLKLEGVLPEPRLLRETLTLALAELGEGSLSLGLSDPLPQGSDVAVGIDQARKAMELGLALSGPGKIAFYDNIALYETFLGKKSENDSFGYSGAMLERLTAHDRAHHSDLLATLKAYVQCDGNSRKAAEQLGIHRHTLKNRLQKIEDLTACPLSGVGRVNYEIALAYHHLYRIKR
jgi:hypothetical protein